MRLILDVIVGPDAPRSFVLSEPGDRIGSRDRPAEWIVGRQSDTDVRLANDLAVSRNHCALRFDGRSWRIRDLGSTHGTGRNGVRINHETELRDGDHVQIGVSVLRVQLQPINRPGSEFNQERPTVSDLGKFPAPAMPNPALLSSVTAPAVPTLTPVHAGTESSDFAGAEVTLGPLNDTQAGVLRSVREQPGTIYAVLDAARDARILNLLHDGDDRYQSLYDGKSAERMAAVAPYLVELPRRSLLLQELIRQGWGNAWGVYLTSTEPFETVRHHLRKFLTVEIEGKEKPVLFRFYDPRVLPTFLDACTPAERAEFQGPLATILAELPADAVDDAKIPIRIFRTMSMKRSG